MIKREKLKKAERSELEILLGKGYSLRSIAGALNRSPNTISYEIRTNGGRKGYRADYANQYARTRAKDKRWQWSKIENNIHLRAYIIAGLHEHWNPDEISGRMKQECQPFYASKTAIYEWLRSIYGQRYVPLLYSKRYYHKKRIPKTKRVMIPDRVSIDERFLGATHRTRYGHWEGDTIVSGKKTGSTAAVSVAYERKTRLVAAQRIENLKPASHTQALMSMLRNKKALSITQDNGIENRNHAELGVPAFFCDPYSSWQKGGVENANKMIRRYIPKGIDLATISQTYLDAIVSIINQKPRRILQYRTALEVASAAGVIQKQSVLIEG
jgi:transposase, IS30 family